MWEDIAVALACLGCTTSLALVVFEVMALAAKATGSAEDPLLHQ